MEDKLTTSSATKQKPRPKPEEQGESPVETIRKDMDNLKACLAKMAHMSGNERVLAEFGIPKWEITKESMRKGGK